MGYFEYIATAGWRKLVEEFNKTSYTIKQWKKGLKDRDPVLLEMVMSLHQRVSRLEHRVEELENNAK